MALLEARKTAPKNTRKCANAYWNDLAKSKQSVADTGDLQTMYQGIKIATGKPTGKVCTS